MQRVFFLITLIVSVSSCNETTDKNSFSQIVIERMGDTIFFPPTLARAAINSSLSHFSESVQNENKLVVYIDGDCGKCIYNLYEWSVFLLNNQNVFTDTRVLFVIYSVNYERFEYTIEKAGVVLPFFYDSLNSYTSINHIDDPVLHTLLLDKSDRVILVGSPINNLAMQELYFTVLLKDSSK